MSSRGSYRSFSRNNRSSGQSYQYSSRMANQQRDTAQMIIKDTFSFGRTFDQVERDGVQYQTGTTQFAFSPLENMMYSNGFKQRCLLYDQVRVTSYTINLVPFLPDANKVYMLNYRWQRDDFPFGEVLPTVIHNPGMEASTVRGVVRAIPERMSVNAAGSSKLRYLNPQTQNSIIASIYAASIQEKSQYIGAFRILDAIEPVEGENEDAKRKRIEEVVAKIDEQTQFNPWLLVQVNNPSNMGTIAFTVEVAANVTFRGVSSRIGVDVPLPPPQLNVRDAIIPTRGQVPLAVNV